MTHVQIQQSPCSFPLQPKSPFVRSMATFLAVSVLVSASLVSGIAQPKSVQASRSWINKEGASILQEYSRLLSLPNHSSDKVNIRKNAQLISEMFSRRGFAMQLLELDGAPPIVYGSITVPKATRTICIYAHYDGQPVDSAHWKNAPFKPKLFNQAIYKGGQPIPFPKKGEAINEDWRIYARSASDDKAPIIALAAAVDALKTAGIGYTSNIKLFFDGEEEAGSPHMQTYLEKYHELFDDITVWLLCDGPVFQTGDPSLKFGGRGVVDMELTVYGPARPLHSGHYGNYAPDPGMLLSQLLASMKDANGNVVIDHFYESTEPVSEFEKAQLKKIPNIETLLREDLGINQPEGTGETLFERLLLPSLTVRGIQTGNVGVLARNVINADAVASLSMRLVKGNDPSKMQDLVEAHIRKQGWHIVYSEPDHATRMKYPRIVKVERGEGSPAAKMSMDHPDILPVIEAVRGFTGEKLVLLPSEGGSNGIFPLIFDGLKKPGISVNMVNHDNNQHADDENVRIGNIWYGVDLMSVMLTMPSPPAAKIRKK